jgi:hypothetical protein
MAALACTGTRTWTMASAMGMPDAAIQVAPLATGPVEWAVH